MFEVQKCMNKFKICKHQKSPQNHRLAEQVQKFKSSREVFVHTRDMSGNIPVRIFEFIEFVIFITLYQHVTRFEIIRICLEAVELIASGKFRRFSLPDHTAFALPGPGEHAIPDRIPHARPLHPQQWRTTCTSRLLYPKQKTIWLWPDINLTGLPSWPLILAHVPAGPCGA